jgi:hypothetical protein
LSILHAAPTIVWFLRSMTQFYRGKYSVVN